MKKVLSLASLTFLSLVSIASAQSLSFSPTSLTLSGTAGNTTPVTTTIMANTTSGTIPYVASSGSFWLLLGATTTSTPSSVLSGSAPGSFVIFANPIGLSTGTYNGTISVSGGGTSATISVTFIVSTIGISPQPPVTFSYVQNSLTFPTAQSLQLTSSSTTQFTVVVPSSTTGTSNNCSWLAVAPLTGSTPALLSVIPNQAAILNLTPATYSCTFTITPANSPNTSLSVLAQLTVTAAPTITLTPSSISLSYQTGTTTTAVPSQTITLSSNGTTAVNYSVTAQTPGFTTSWISLNKNGGTLTPPGNTDQVTVTYNTAVSLPASTTPYQGQIIVTADNTSQTIPVSLLVSNSALLNVTPSAVSFTSELGGSSPAPVTVEATATSGTPTINVQTSNNTPWLFASFGQTITSATSACPAPPCIPITISANASGLTLGKYTGTVSVYGAENGANLVNSPLNVAVTLNVANDALISTNVSTTEPMIFAYQSGGPASPTQTIAVSSTTGATLTYSASFANSPTEGCGSNWLTLSGATSGNTNGSFTATANPSGITPATSGAACAGTISITAANASTSAAAPNSPYQIPVNFYVSANALLVLNPDAAPAFSAQPGLLTSVTSQNCTTNGTVNCNLTLSNTSTTDPINILSVTPAETDNTGWLTAGVANGSIAAGGSTTLAISLAFVPSTAGSYSGTVTIKAVAQSGSTVLDSPIVIPVTLQVTAGTPIASPTSLSFTQTLGGAAPGTQTITVGSSTGTSLNFTAAATSSTATPWLSVTPPSGSTPATLTVTANGSSLNASTTPYTGQITITAAGSANVVNVPVTLTVNAGTLSATPASLTFSQAAGGSAPAALPISVSGTPGALSFTATAATSTGGNWLSVSPGNGTTPGTVSVTASAGTLAVGTYNGTVTIASTGAIGSPITIPVTLNVLTAQTLSVSPSALNFSAIVNQPSPSAQTASLTSSGSGTSFTATATPSSGGNWLTVSPASGVTPAQLTVSVATQTLAAGNYTGTIAINSPNATSTLNLTVNLTVASIPTPVITAVQNAASYAIGGVSPGENIYIKGTGIGPANLTVAAPSAAGVYPTTLANTQVFFGSVAAPILYVSATATSVMVPYEVAGQPTTSVTVVYSSVSSTPLTYNVVSTAPGIYTLNQSGTGPGAILNQNYSVNGPTAPAAPGSVIAVYMTGEGATSPPSSDGILAPVNGTGLNKPTQTVTATIGGVNAPVQYYGSAPGIIYGVMQVNVTVPSGLSNGTQPIVITVGSVSTQTGVTINVQSTGSTEPEQ